MSNSVLAPTTCQWRSECAIEAISASVPPPKPKYPHAILTPVAFTNESGSFVSARSNEVFGCKRLQCERVAQVKTQRCTNSVGAKNKNNTDPIQLRRERNRQHQARHKMKQQKLMTDLENSIYHLKEEIQELKLQRQLIYYGVPTFTNIWGVATEFFRLFRNSVQPPTLLAGSRGEYNTQENFLRATMTSDVTDGIVCGVDALLETWAMQSVCYQDIDLQPVRMYNVPNDSMVATTKGRLTINENTLRFAFPHLITESENWSDLPIKMLGQQLELHGSVEFQWDSESGRVTSIVCKADILTPLQALLGSLDDVSCVFDKARLSPDGRLVLP